MKKILLSLFSFLMVFSLACVLLACDGCSPEEQQRDPNTGTDGFVWSEENNGKTTLKEGFTSLENKYENGEIDAEGYYTVAGQKIKTKDVYKTIYQIEPTNDLFNYLTNQWTYNSEHYTNMLDGLVENNKYGELVGALAEGYKTEINEDGTETWTFQLKEGVAWVDNKTGNVYAEVVAQDFVDGIKYVLDPINGSSTVGIITGLIAGSAEYYAALNNKETADFSTVGVKAVSKYEVAYTLYQATPYFLSSLTYSPFLPVNGKYLEDQGSDFGKTENNILVCGAFRITEHKASNLIAYTKNDKYWDKKHVYVNRVEKTFYNSSTAEATTTRKWFESGLIDSFSVRVNGTDEEGYNKYVAGADGTGSVTNPASELCNPVLSVGDATYIGYYNFSRTTFEYNDVAEKTQKEKDATFAAIQNKNFRKGILYGLDVMSFLEYYNSRAPQEWLMRGYTNRELISFVHNYDGTTVGDYADIVDLVYNKKQGTTGVTLSGINNGSDPVFDEEKAKAFLLQAKQELMAEGLTEDDFPIRIDIVGNQNKNVDAFQNAMLDKFNALAEGIAKFVPNYAKDEDQDTKWNSVYYNFDFSMWSGWGPDYADPATYLHTVVIGGDMVDSMGLGSTASKELQEKVLGEYTKLYDKANAITASDKLADRYYAFAEAEYYLIYEEALIVPWLTQSGYAASVARTVPWQAGRATYGLTGDKLKNVVVSSDITTQEIRNAITQAYNEGKNK